MVTPSAATGLSDPLLGSAVMTPTSAVATPGAPLEHCSVSVAGAPSVTEAASVAAAKEEGTAAGAEPVRAIAAGAGEGNDGLPMEVRWSKRQRARRGA